jgi:hypothetical protein
MILDAAVCMLMDVMGNFTFQMYDLAVVSQDFTHNYMYTP